MTYFQMGLVAVYSWGFITSWKIINRWKGGDKTDAILAYCFQFFLSATWPAILFMSVIEWSQEYQINQHREKKK